MPETVFCLDCGNPINRGKFVHPLRCRSCAYLHTAKRKRELHPRWEAARKQREAQQLRCEAAA